MPIAFGLFCGLLLGLSEPAYLIATVLAIGGGFFAGLDHLGPREGAKRGALGGLLFGASILIGHELHGQPAEAKLPDPAILLLVVTILPGIGLGALGGRARLRAQSRTDLSA